jgi:hypothetical protein
LCSNVRIATFYCCIGHGGACAIRGASCRWGQRGRAHASRALCPGWARASELPVQRDDIEWQDRAVVKHHKLLRRKLHSVRAIRGPAVRRLHRQSPSRDLQGGFRSQASCVGCPWSPCLRRLRVQRSPGPPGTPSPPPPSFPTVAPTRVPTVHSLQDHTRGAAAGTVLAAAQFWPRQRHGAAGRGVSN